MVALEDTFEMLCYKATLREVQGHKIKMNCENYHFFVVLDIDYLWHYLQNTCQLWSNLLNDMTYGDLEQRWTSQGKLDMWIVYSIAFYLTLHSVQLWNLPKR